MASRALPSDYCCLKHDMCDMPVSGVIVIKIVGKGDSYNLVVSKEKIYKSNVNVSLYHSDNVVLILGNKFVLMSLFKGKGSAIVRHCWLPIGTPLHIRLILFSHLSGFSSSSPLKCLGLAKTCLEIHPI